MKPGARRTSRARPNRNPDAPLEGEFLLGPVFFFQTCSGVLNQYVLLHGEHALRRGRSRKCRRRRHVIDLAGHRPESTQTVLAKTSTSNKPDHQPLVRRPRVPGVDLGLDVEFLGLGPQMHEVLGDLRGLDHDVRFRFSFIGCIPDRLPLASVAQLLEAPPTSDRRRARAHERRTDGRPARLPFDTCRYGVTGLVLDRRAAFFRRLGALPQRPAAAPADL